MSEDVENTTTWKSDPRLRYLVPVVVVLGLIFLILALAASCSGRDNGRGLKPFRPTHTPQAEGADGEVLTISFVDLNGAPATYQNQRIRVTGDKITIPPLDCRLYTGPLFSWGLIAEDLQLNALGFEELLARLPDGLTLTVEGVWRKYDGPLGCGKEPDDGAAWYLQVERIISPNPLPLVEGANIATIQVLMGTQAAVNITPFMTGTPETAVTSQTPGIGITPLPPGIDPYPEGTVPPSGTGLPTFTPNPAFPTASLMPGLTPSVTPSPNGTVTPTPTGTIISGSTPMPTAPGINTQTPQPTVPGYPGLSTPLPTIDPYS